MIYADDENSYKNSLNNLEESNHETIARTNTYYFIALRAG